MSTATDRSALEIRCDYNPAAKAQFHKVAAKYLQRLKKELSDIFGEGSIRHNQGGIAVSGEVTLHLEALYVQVSQSSMGPRGTVLYRRCEGLKDYRGGQNNFATAEELMDTARFARIIEERVSSTQQRGERV